MGFCNTFRTGVVAKKMNEHFVIKSESAQHHFRVCHPNHLCRGQPFYDFKQIGIDAKGQHGGFPVLSDHLFCQYQERQIQLLDCVSSGLFQDSPLRFWKSRVIYSVRRVAYVMRKIAFWLTFQPPPAFIVFFFTSAALANYPHRFWLLQSNRRMDPPMRLLLWTICPVPSFTSLFWSFLRTVRIQTQFHNFS